MRPRNRFAGFLVLGLGLFCGTNAVASVTEPNCGGFNQRACTIFDTTFWANNSGFCDFGLKSNKGILTALSGGSSGTCVNDTRQTAPKDNSWVGWALSQQRYGVQASLPINYITHLGTHNSFSNYSDKDNNWLSTNQQYSITDQLNFGARVIRIDPHYYFGEMRTCHSETNAVEDKSATKVLESCTSQAIAQYLPIALLLAPHLTEIHLLPTPIPTIIDGYVGSVLAQAAVKGTIAINNRLFANAIKEVGDWLSANPGEFIVLMMNDYSEGNDDLINTPIQNFLGSKVWAPSDQAAYSPGDGSYWPTMAALQQQKKQVILFSLSDTHGAKWIFNEDTYFNDVYPKIAGSGNHKTDADLSDNPSFWSCNPRTAPFNSQSWLQTGEGRTGSDYLFGPFTGEMNAPQVTQAAACGFSTIRLDFFMALNKAYSEYSDNNPDVRREAAVWSYAPDDFGQAGPAVMMATTGRWTSVNPAGVLPLACATTDANHPRQWAVTLTVTDYFTGVSKTDPCHNFVGGYAFAAPRTAAENADLWTALKAAHVAQAMLNYSAVPIPPAYISPTLVDAYMDRGGVAPEQVVDKVNGYHNLWFLPQLLSNESNALSIVQPTDKTPLEGGFVPLTLQYDQLLSQNLATGLYGGQTALNLYTNSGPNQFADYVYSPHTAASVNLHVLEPTVTHMVTNQSDVEVGAKANFTVTVAPLCGVKPVDRENGGVIPITGVVTFTDVYQPTYGGPPVTQVLGVLPIGDFSDQGDSNLFMQSVIDNCPTDALCAYTTSLGEGRHNITAVYQQDGLYNSSSSSADVIDVVYPARPWNGISLALGTKQSQTLTFSGIPGDTWQINTGLYVTATPNSGTLTTTSATFTVAIKDTPGLLPGVYSTNVNINRTSGGVLVVDSFEPVTVTVPTTLSVAQTPLSFTTNNGTPSAQQEIAVTYQGGALNIVPEVGTPQQWLVAGLDPPGPQSRGTQAVNVWADVNPTGLAPGHYAGVLHIGAPSGPGVFSVPVSLDVFSTLPQYTIATVPAGMQVLIDGVQQPTPVSFSWTPGSNHTLSAPPGFQISSDGVRAVWTGWSDGGAIAHSVTANGSQTYAANFKLQYQLTAENSPACGGVVTPAGNWYDAGSAASVSAAPASGYGFGSFTGDASSASRSISIPMNGPKSVTANYSCPGGPCPGVLPVTYATGDVNHDGRVDCNDVAIVKAAFGKKTGQAGFDPRADINGDGVVDVRDLAIVTQQLPSGVSCQ